MLRIGNLISSLIGAIAAVPLPATFVLLEDGTSFLLLESGSKIILE